MEAVEELNKLFGDGDGIVFMNNLGLSVGDMTQFRSGLRKNGVKVKVAKNTLIKRALEESGVEVDDNIQNVLVGPTMIAFGLEDAVSPAKGVVDFLKDNEGKLEIKGGLLEQKFLDTAGVDQLSKLPSREELIAQLLGSLNAPAQNFCYALNAAVSQFAWALSAYERKLQEEGG